MNVQRDTLLKFLIVVLLATMTSALSANAGLLQDTGVNLGCTEDCNGYSKVLEKNGTEYTPNASSTLSATTSMGFMAMFLWTLLSLL